MILKEYFRNNSLVKSSMNAGISPNRVISWFLEGQKGNSQYRMFYLRLKAINNLNSEVVEKPEKVYEISQHAGSWCYTTYADGEKISFIAGDLENLENIVKSHGLPFDG